MCSRGDTGLYYLYFPSQYARRNTRPKDQVLKRTSGDAIVQDFSRPPARSERCSVMDRTSTSAPRRALGYSTSTRERPPRIHRGRKLSPGEPASEEPRFSWSIFFLLSKGQIRVRFVKLLAILTPPSYHPLPQDVSHLGRVSPSFPALPHVVSPSQPS